MREYVVAKTFNTANRRLAVGAPVAETDELEPFTFAERLENSYLRPKVGTEPAAPSPPPRARVRQDASGETE